METEYRLRRAPYCWWNLNDGTSRFNAHRKEEGSKDFFVFFFNDIKRERDFAIGEMLIDSDGIADQSRGRTLHNCSMALTKQELPIFLRPDWKEIEFLLS